VSKNPEFEYGLEGAEHKRLHGELDTKQSCSKETACFDLLVLVEGAQQSVI
jgi:hypothetical protein